MKVCALAGFPVRHRRNYQAPKLRMQQCHIRIAWELSSPDSFGGGGREDPLAHRLSQAAQHRSIKDIDDLSI